jgi:hypothetical protein
MNGNRRARPRRYGVAAVVAAALLGVVALLASGCGSSSSSNAATTAADSQQKAALAYAQCMRDNGVANFPDPDANGQFRGAGHELQNTPNYQAALQACRNKAPGGSHQQEMGTPAFVNQLRVFARCMRANGMPDFPDPGSGGITAAFASKVEALRTDPRFPDAVAACRNKVPGGAGHQGP